MAHDHVVPAGHPNGLRPSPRPAPRCQGPELAGAGRHHRHPRHPDQALRRRERSAVPRRAQETGPRLGLRDRRAGVRSQRATHRRRPAASVRSDQPTARRSTRHRPRAARRGSCSSTKRGGGNRRSSATYEAATASKQTGPPMAGLSVCTYGNLPYVGVTCWHQSALCFNYLAALAIRTFILRQSYLGPCRSGLR